jgi:hypothetical protein
VRWGIGLLLRGLEKPERDERDHDIQQINRVPFNTSAAGTGSCSLCCGLAGMRSEDCVIAQILESYGFVSSGNVHH